MGFRTPCSSSILRGDRFLTTTVPFLLLRVSSKRSSTWCTLTLPSPPSPPSFPRWMSSKVDSVGVPMSSSVPWFPYCPLVLSSTRSSLSSIFRKHLSHHGLRTPVRIIDAGVRDRMWNLMCHFLHDTQSQDRCDSSLRPLTRLCHRSRPSPLSTSCQISSSTASPRLYDELSLMCSSLHRPCVFQDSCTPMILSCQRNASLICNSLWAVWHDGVDNLA